jgi:Mn-dependent DtxR family transcriptional regulator
MRENDESGTPKDLKESGLIRVSQAHISRRLKKLAEHHLVKHVGHGAYVITEEGKAYLDEEYDADEETYINSQDSDVSVRGSTSGANGT